MHPRDATDVITMAPVPPGVVQNIENPDYIGHSIVTCNIACLTLAGLVVVLRLYTRAFIVRNIGKDDIAMILAMVFSICLSAATIMLTHFGLGVHMWDLPMTQFTPHFLKWNLIAAMLYCVAIMFTKLSILLLYLRLSPSRQFRMGVYSLMAVAVGYNIASVFANLFSCSPIAGSWDLTIKATCMDRPVFYYINAALNISTDFAILILPIKLVWQLQMPKRQKYSVLGIFLAGGFVCIVSIIRLYALYDLQKSPDLSWVTVNALVWCLIEVNVGIICGSLSTVKPFIRQHFPRLLGSTAGGDAYRPSGGYSGGGSTPMGGLNKSRTKSTSIPLSSIDASQSRLELGEGGIHEVTCKSHGSRRGRRDGSNKLGFSKDEDSISEEHIMPSSPVGIVRTTEVDVQFSEREDHRRGSSSAGSEDERGSVLHMFSNKAHGR